MPPKNWESGPIVLAWSDGRTKYEISEIRELELEGFREHAEVTPALIRNTCVGEITGTFKTNRKLFLRLVLGKSNNWLKMHGYPMVRGRYLK